MVQCISKISQNKQNLLNGINVCAHNAPYEHTGLEKHLTVLLR